MNPSAKRLGLREVFVTVSPNDFHAVLRFGLPSPGSTRLTLLDSAELKELAAWLSSAGEIVEAAVATAEPVKPQYRWRPAYSQCLERRQARDNVYVTAEGWPSWRVTLTIGAPSNQPFGLAPNSTELRDLIEVFLSTAAQLDAEAEM